MRRSARAVAEPRLCARRYSDRFASRPIRSRARKSARANSPTIFAAISATSPHSTERMTRCSGCAAARRSNAADRVEPSGRSAPTIADIRSSVRSSHGRRAGHREFRRRSRRADFRRGSRAARCSGGNRGRPGRWRERSYPSAAGVQDRVRGELKLWLPRHAERLAQRVELQVTRNEVRRQTRNAFARAEPSELDPSSEKAIARTAHCRRDARGNRCDIRGARSMERARATRVVRYVTPMYPDPQPQSTVPWRPNSMIGDVCRDGTPLHGKSGARRATRPALRARTRSCRASGALAILPMRAGRAS